MGVAEAFLTPKRYRRAIVAKLVIVTTIQERFHSRLV